MAYATLTAEIRGEWSSLRNSLVEADNKMRSMARQNYRVQLRLDTKQFGNDLGRVIGALRKIAASPITAGVNISVNGVPLAVTGIKQVTDATKEAVKEQKNLQDAVQKGMNAPTARGGTRMDAAQHKGLQDNLKRDADAMNKAQAEAIRLNKALDELNRVGMGKAFGFVSSRYNDPLEAAKMIAKNARAFNGIQEELKKAGIAGPGGNVKLNRQKEVDDYIAKARELLRVNKEAVAKQQQLSSLLDRLGRSGGKAMLPYLKGIQDVDKAIAATQSRLNNLRPGRSSFWSPAVGQQNLAALRDADAKRAAQEAAAKQAQLDNLLGRVGRAGGTAILPFLRGIQDVDKAIARAQVALNNLQPPKGMASAFNANAAAARQMADATRQADLEMKRLESDAAKINRAVDMLRAKGLGHLSKQITDDPNIGGKQALERARQLIDAQRQLDAANKKAEASSRRTGAAIRKMGDDSRYSVSWLDKVKLTLMAFGTSYLIIRGIHQLFAGLKDVLFDFPAMLEQTRMGFIGLFGGSEKRADDMMNRLKQFAIPTPFEMSDLAPAAQQAVAFGLVDKNSRNAGKETVSYLRDIGDAAFGLGRGKEGVDRLNLALGQMKVATRVMSQEMLQMQQLGLNAWKYIADAMGVSTAKARELVKDGLVPADKAIRAIREGIRRDFGGAMERASKTALGALAQIKDALRVNLSDTFKNEFDRVSQFLVGVADQISSSDFQAKLSEQVGKVRDMLAVAEGVVRGFYDTIIRLNPQAVAAFTLLAATLNGSPLAAITAFAFAVNTYTHWEEATGKAKVLTLAITALGSAFLVAKINAALLSAEIGLAAAKFGVLDQVVKAGGMTAFFAKLGGWILGLKQFASVFKFMAGEVGVLATLSNLLGGLAASISAVALYALPVLVAALGVGGTMYEKYQEKAAIASAANASLADSVKDVDKAFAGLSKYSKLTEGAGELVTNLKNKFNASKTSPSALNNFIGNDLSKARGDIAVNLKLKPFERRLLLAELDKLQATANDHAVKLQTSIDAESANKTWLSWSNFAEAFYQTWGRVGDVFKWLGGQVAFFFKALWSWAKWAALGVWGFFGDMFKGLKDGWNIVWYDFTGGYESAINRFIRWTADKFTYFFGWLGKHIKGTAKAIADFLTAGGGYAANYDQGEDKGIPGYGAAYNADQKRRNREYMAQQAAQAKLGLQYGPPRATPAQLAEEQARKDREAFEKAMKANQFHFSPDPGKPGKDSAKTKAENAAKRLEADKLQDAADKAEKSAKAIEESAKRTIEAMKTLAERMRDVFGGAQEDLLRFGVTLDTKIISRFERLAGLGGKLSSVFNKAFGASQALRGAGLTAREKLDKLRGGDGSEPGKAMGIVGAAGASAADNMLVSLAKEFNAKADRSLGASCGDVASRVLNKIGYNLRYSANAAQLEKNAIAAGWVMVPLGTPGSLNVQSGKGFGKKSGAHTSIGIGGGRVVSSSGYQLSQYSIVGAKGNPRAYAPAGAVPNLLGGMDATGGLDDVLRGLDLTFSRMAQLPAAWGAVVKDSESTTYRFKAQMMLADKQTQMMLRTVLGADFDPFVAELRKGMNELDAFTMSVKANDAAQKSLKELRDKSAMRGKEDDVFAQLGARRATGGDLQFASEKMFGQLHDATLRGALDDLWQANHDFVKSEEDKRKVIELAAPAFHAGASASYDYARATEIASKQVEFWRQKEVKSLLKEANALDERGKKLRELARLASSEKDPSLRAWGMHETAGFDAEGRRLQIQANQIRTDLNAQWKGIAAGVGASFDTDRAEGRRQGVLSRRGELSRQNDRLREQLALVNDLSKSRGELSNTLAKNADYYTELDRLLGEGHGLEADSLAKEFSLAEDRNRALERAVELATEMRAFREDDARKTNYLQEQITVYRGVANNVSGLNDVLKYQAELSEKIAEYSAKGYDDYVAKGVAREVAVRNANIRALEKELDLRKEVRQATEDAARLVGEGAARRGILGSTDAGSMAQERALRMLEENTNLQRRIDNGEFDKTTFSFTGLPRIERDLQSIQALKDAFGTKIDEDIKNAVAVNKGNAELASRNRVLDANVQLQLAELEANNKLTDSMRAQIEFQAEIEKRKGTTNEVTDKEIADNKTLLGILDKLSKLRFDTAVKDVQKQIEAMALPSGAAGGYQREDFLRRYELAKQFPGEDIDKLLDNEKILRKAQELENGLKDIWSGIRDSFAGAFEDMWNSGGSFFDKILAGVESFSVSILRMFQKLAAQILANWVITQLIQLIPGASDVFRIIGAAANSGISVPGIGGGNFPAGGGGGNNSVSPGLGAGLANRSSAVGGAMMRASSVSNQSITVNHYGDVVTDNPQEYREKMLAESGTKSTQTAGYDSRRTTSQNVRSVVNYGGRQQLG